MECAEKPKYLGKNEFFLLSHIEKHKARGHIFRDTTTSTKLFFLYRKTRVSKHEQTHIFLFLFPATWFLFHFHQTVNSSCILDLFSTLVNLPILSGNTMHLNWGNNKDCAYIAASQSRNSYEVGTPKNQQRYSLSQRAFRFNIRNCKGIQVEGQEGEYDATDQHSPQWIYFTACSPLELKSLFGYLHWKISSNEKLSWIHKQSDKKMCLPFWFMQAFDSHPLQCSP